MLDCIVNRITTVKITDYEIVELEQNLELQTQTNLQEKNRPFKQVMKIKQYKNGLQA